MCVLSLLSLTLQIDGIYTKQEFSSALVQVSGIMHLNGQHLLSV